MGINFNVIRLNSVSSTSDYLKKMRNYGQADHGTLVISKTQTAGRGRLDNSWLSPVGNLYFSFLVQPKLDINKAYFLPFFISVVIGDVISDILDDDINLQYKWPNDIMLNNKKIAGILMESMVKNNIVDSVIIGVGINTAVAPHVKNAESTSIVDENEECIADDELLKRILSKFSDCYEDWLKGKVDMYRKAWLSKAAYIGETIVVRTDDTSHLGVFKDINDRGELVLLLSNGRYRSISYGEIFVFEHA